MTICPDYESGFKEDFLEKYNLTADDIRELNFPILEKMSAAEFYDKVTFSLKDIVSKTKIRTIHPREKMSYELDESKITSFDFVYGNEKMNSDDDVVQTIHNAENYWTSVNYLKLGKCFTFSPPDWIKKLEVIHHISN